MIVSTLATINENEYDIIGPVSGLSVHAISYFRTIFAGISGLFGGRQSAIKEKFMDVRREAIYEMVETAKLNNIDMIAGMQVELTELGQEFVVCIATGTALRKKTTKTPKKSQVQENLLSSPKKTQKK